MSDTRRLVTLPLRRMRPLGPVPVPVLAVLATIYLIIALGDGLRWGGADGLHWWADSGWTLSGALALTACLRTARRAHGRERAVWLLFAGGCASWLLGQLAWDYFELVARAFPPAPTLADAGFLGYTPAFMAGLLLVGRGRSASWTLLGVDIAIVALSMVVLITILFYPDLQRSSLSNAARATSLLYPFCYVTLAGTILLLTDLRAWRHRSLRLLLLGLIAEVIPFVIWTPLLLRGTFAEGGPLDVTWMVGMLLIAAGALLFTGFPDVAVETQVTGLTPLLPMIPALGCLILVTGNPVVLGHEAFEGLRFTLAVGIYGLVTVRLGLTLRSNRQLLGEARHQRDQTELLKEIGLQLSQAVRDPALVAHTIARAALDLAQAHSALVVVRRQSLATVVAAEGACLSALVGRTFDVTDLSPAGKVISAALRDAPLTVLRGTGDGSGLPPGLSDGARSLVVIALATPEGSLGALVVTASAVDHFDARKLRALQALAGLAGLAVENAQFYDVLDERLRARTAQLDELSRMGAEIGSQLDAAALVPRLAAAARRLTGAEYAAVLLGNPAGGFRVGAIEAPDPDAWLVDGQLRGLGALGPLMRQGRTIRWSAPPGGFAHRPAGQPPVASVLGTSIHGHDGAMLGAFVLGHPDSDVFDATAEDLLTTLATYATVALTNAQLFARTEQQHRFKTVLAQLSDPANATLDPDDLLPRICPMVAGAFDLASVSVFLLDGPDTLTLAATTHAGIAPRLAVPLTARSLAVADAAPSLPAEARRVIAAGLAAAAVLAVPICANDEIVGVLALSSDRADNFDDTDPAHATQIAHVIGDLLRNARLHRREQEVAARLRRAERWRTSFLRVMAHEIRTPLGQISGFTDLLGDEAAGLNGRGQRYLANTREAAAKLEVLVQRSFDLMRLYGDEVVLDRAPVDIASLLEVALARGRVQAESKGIALEYMAAPVRTRVGGDMQRLHQAIDILLDNAVKFTPPGGKVVVEVARRHESLEIAVADSGPGVGADVRDYIFAAGQAEDTLTRQQGGMGLGLLMARRIAALHGGELRLDTPVQGARFVLSLPARPAGDSEPWPATG